MLFNNVISLWENKQYKYLIKNDKWAPVIRHIAPEIDETYMSDICWFMECLAIREINMPNLQHQTLPLNLKIISGIKDLSKINFVETPQIGYTYHCSMNQDILYVVANNHHPINIIQECESLLVKMLCDEINSRIDNGSIVNVYSFVESVSLISTEGFAPSLYLRANMSIE